MVFRSREEMEKYMRYLKIRDIRRKMSLWRIVLMLIICVVTTYLAFVFKESLFGGYEEALVTEKLSYCMWCLFMVVLTRGIIRTTDYTGLRKFAVILSGSLASSLIVMCENSLLMYAPYYHYITFNGFLENIVTDFINDGIYGTLRFPVMFVVTILVAYIYSSKTYHMLIKKIVEKIELSYFESKVRSRLIETFNVSEEEYNDGI